MKTLSKAGRLIMSMVLVAVMTINGPAITSFADASGEPAQVSQGYSDPSVSEEPGKTGDETLIPNDEIEETSTLDVSGTESDVTTEFEDEEPDDPGDPINIDGASLNIEGMSTLSAPALMAGAGSQGDEYAVNYDDMAMNRRNELQPGWHMLTFSYNGFDYYVPMNPGNSILLGEIADALALHLDYSNGSLNVIYNRVVSSDSDSMDATPVYSDDLFADYNLTFNKVWDGALTLTVSSYTSINDLFPTTYTVTVTVGPLRISVDTWIIETGRGNKIFRGGGSISQTLVESIMSRGHASTDAFYTGSGWDECSDNLEWRKNADRKGFFVTKREFSDTKWVELIVPNSSGGYTTENFSFTTDILKGSGTEDDPFLIGNVSEWNRFAVDVNYGVNADKIYKLTDNIGGVDDPITTIVGTDFPFEGTFDGNGKTVNVDIYNAGNDNTALFGKINGAVIKDLTVKGNISGVDRCAGLVAMAEGTGNRISNCIVNADVSALESGNRTIGGVIGSAGSSSVVLENIIFGGSLSNNGDYAGGLIGICDEGANLFIDRCFFNGKVSDFSHGKFHPVALRNTDASVTAVIKNVYYTSEPTITETGNIISDSENRSTVGLVELTAPSEKMYAEHSVCDITVYEPVSIDGMKSFYVYSGNNLASTIVSSLTIEKVNKNAEIVKDIDYTVSFKRLSTEVNEVTEKGTYKIFFTGIGNYIGSESFDFVVGDSSLLGEGVITWSKLQAAMSIGGDITLDADVIPGVNDIDSYLYVPEGVTVNLDLNGHTIDRGLNHGRLEIENNESTFADPDSVESGCVINVAGTLIINDSIGSGKITGGNNSSYYSKIAGGGLYISASGICTMNGGTISGNIAQFGGGVQVSGIFNLNGGVICDNVAREGGGVEIDYRTYKNPALGMYMYGGTIERNTANRGAGIDAGGTFYMYDGVIRENNAITMVYPQYNYVRHDAESGGVHANLTFEMYGGKIIDNTSTGKGGGIGIINSNGPSYASANSGGDTITFSKGISGKVTITGNSLTNGTASNLVFYGDEDLGYGDIGILQELDSSSRVGITGRPLGGRVVTDVSEKGSLSNFFSDEPEYELKLIDGDIWTVRKAAMVIQKPSVDGFDWLYSASMEPIRFVPNQGSSRRGIYYNGQTQQLLSSPGLAADGTMVYALGTKDTVPDDSTFSETIPTATYVGVYYIWYKAKGNGGYIDSAAEGPLMIDIFPCDLRQGSYCCVKVDTPTPISDIIKQVGCNASVINAVDITTGRSDTCLYQEDGIWMVRISKKESAYNVRVYLSNGYIADAKICAIYDEERSFKLHLLPQYGENEQIVVTIDNNYYYLPELSREGYRFLGWGHMGRESSYNSNRVNTLPAGTLVTANFNGNNNSSVNASISAFSDIYLYARWEAIEDVILIEAIDALSAGEFAEEVFMGGQPYVQIGKGDGKKLFISKDALETNAISNVEKAAMVDTSWSYARNGYSSSANGDIQYTENVIRNHGKVFDLTHIEICRYLPSVESRKVGTAWEIYDEGEYASVDNNSNPYRLAFVTPDGVFDDARLRQYGIKRYHRYAFVLDESYVFFSSVYDGTKPVPDGDFGTPMPGSGIQKLTLLDSGRNFEVSNEISAVNAGGNINIAYTGAGSGENEYVSCMLLDANGNLKGYASHDTQGDSDGTWNITIPSDTPAGRYSLKLFSEQRNGAQETDFASSPVEIPIKVVNGPVENLTINGDDSVIYGDSIVLSARINGEDISTGINWSSSDTNVLNVDSTGKITTVHVGEAIVTVASSGGFSYKKIKVTPKTIGLAFSPDAVQYSFKMHWCPEIVATGLVEGDECDVYVPYGGHYLYYRMMWDWVNKKVWYQDGTTSLWYFAGIQGNNYLDELSITLSNPDYKLPADLPILTYEILPINLEFEWSNTEFIYNGEECCPTVLCKGFDDYLHGNGTRIIPQELYTPLPMDRELKVSGGQTNVGTYEATALKMYTESFTEQYYLHNDAWLINDSEDFFILPTDRTITFTISPKTVGIDWSSNRSSVVYTGNAVSPTPALTGLCGNDKCDVTVGKIEKLGEDGSTWSEVSEAREIGSYKATVTALGNNNYKLPETGRSFEFEIKESITPVVTIADGIYTYNGDPLMPSFTVLKEVNGEELSSSDYEYEFSNNVSAGNNAKLTVSAAENGDYVFDPVTVTFTIERATHGDETISLYVIAGAPLNDITVTLPALPDGVSEYGTPIVNGTLIDGIPAVSQSTLTYSATSQDVGESATITLAVAQSENYEAYDIVITVTAVDKTETDVSIFKGTDVVSSPTSAVYGDEAFALSATAENTEANGNWTWYSNDTSVATVSSSGVVTVIGAGTAVIKASYDSYRYFGYEEITLRVNRKVLELRWGDTSFIYNGEEQKPSVRISGVLENDDCDVEVMGEKTDVGEGYSALAVLTGVDKDNYMLPENKTCNFSIKKKPEPADPGAGTTDPGQATADPGQGNDGTTTPDTGTDNGNATSSDQDTVNANLGGNAQGNTSDETTAITVVSNDTQKTSNATETTAAQEEAIAGDESAQDGSGDAADSDGKDAASGLADTKTDSADAANDEAEVSISEEKKSGMAPWQYGLVGTGAVVIVSGAALFTKKRFGFKFK